MAITETSSSLSENETTQSIFENSGLLRRQLGTPQSSFMTMQSLPSLLLPAVQAPTHTLSKSLSKHTLLAGQLSALSLSGGLPRLSAVPFFNGHLKDSKKLVPTFSSDIEGIMTFLKSNSMRTIQNGASTITPELMRLPRRFELPTFASSQNPSLIVNLKGAAPRKVENPSCAVKQEAVAELSVVEMQKTNAATFKLLKTEYSKITEDTGVLDELIAIMMGIKNTVTGAQMMAIKILQVGDKVLCEKRDAMRQMYRESYEKRMSRCAKVEQVAKLEKSEKIDRLMSDIRWSLMRLWLKKEFLHTLLFGQPALLDGANNTNFEYLTKALFRPFNELSNGIFCAYNATQLLQVLEENPFTFAQCCVQPLSREQEAHLLFSFWENPYPNQSERKQIAAGIGADAQRVLGWFETKRRSPMFQAKRTKRRANFSQRATKSRRTC